MSTTDGTLQTANQGASGVSAEAVAMLNTFWDRTTNEISCLSPKAFKTHELPLARIKKIMKLDEDVKMISAEAPVLFAKAAEIFISELSLRAWVHTEDNKRRTLQRNDIAMAISKYDQFDFLIDIVPREELKPTKRPEDTVRTNTSMVADQVQFFIQMAQQATGNAATVGATTTVQQQALQQPADQQQVVQSQVTGQLDTAQVQQAVTVPVTSTAALQQAAAQALLQTQQQQALQAAQANAAATQAIVVTQTAGVATPQQTIQLPAGHVLQQPFQIVGQSATTTIPTASMSSVTAKRRVFENLPLISGLVTKPVIPVGGQQVIQIPQPVQTTSVPQQAVQTPIVTPTQQATHVYQQVVTPSGEIQNVPIQITPAQFQAIQLQLQGKQAGQSIVIQTPQQTAVTDQTQFATAQPMYQIQQLAGGQPVFLPQTVHTTESGVEAQVTEVQDTAT